jgi:hypothetical protein
MARKPSCPHPARYVHATFDPRWEVCDLCHTPRRAPLPAPWVVAHDAAQPAPVAPELFPEPGPTAAPEPAAAPAHRSRRQPASLAERLAIPGSLYTLDEAYSLLAETGYTPGLMEYNWRTSPLPARNSRKSEPLTPPITHTETPAGLARCDRCGGTGRVAEPGHTYEHTCPRCHGEREIGIYCTA